MDVLHPAPSADEGLDAAVFDAPPTASAVDDLPLRAASAGGLPLATATPDRETMLKHLVHLFGGLEDDPRYCDGRVEISSMTRVKRRHEGKITTETQNRARFFRLTELEAAVDYALQRTAKGEKIYVHVGLLRPDYKKIVAHDNAIARNELPLVGHSGGDGVLCWPSLWGEADHVHLDHARTLRGEDRNAARRKAFGDVARDHGFRWSWAHSTGTVPSVRLQGFARLTEPAAPDDPRFWKVLKSVSINGNLDGGACNSSQVLRLGGSVSFAGSGTKDAEVGEAARIDERVVCLMEREDRVGLHDLHRDLEAAGKLRADALPPEARSDVAARDLGALMARVRPPENAPEWPRDRVRAAVERIVAQVARVEAGANRRDAALAAGKTVGGLLWTGAFTVDELLDEDYDTENLDIDGPGMSLMAAYELSGGAGANGWNDLATGLLAPLANGAQKPLRSLPMPSERTEGEAFGVVEEDDGELPPERAERKEQLQAAKREATFKDVVDFEDEYTPLEYVLDSVLVAGRLYFLTAMTGAGKTTLMSSVALAVAIGEMSILGAETACGRVAYFSFENPDDFRLKMMAARVAHKIRREDIAGRIKICDEHRSPQQMLRMLNEDGGEFSLIIVDTLQAAFVGSNSNSPDELKKFVQSLRPLTRLPGRPAVIVPAHPTKGVVPKEQLVPYGSGSILNECDGNLCLYQELKGGPVYLHHVRKLRQPDFQPMSFALES